MKRRIEMVFVDEAGLYSLPALRGLIAIRDHMVEEGGRLTLVLIGMDDLPTKIDQNPQVAGRVHEWCFFEPYTPSETEQLVRAISPLWASADSENLEVQRQLTFLHQASNGIPGHVVPFVQKVEQEVAGGQKLSVALLKAVQLRTARNRKQSQTAQRNAYRNQPIQNTGKATP
jgi:type II secretory pathway predicted ATPase ExeA